MTKEKITILCSGITLGVYVPGLIINRQLVKKGYPTEICVLENLFFTKKQKKIFDLRIAYHQNFKVALLGQKLAQGSNSKNIDPCLVNDLLTQWKQEKRKRFIVFSGFWLPILDQYLQEKNICDLSIDLCHLDADFASSWKSNKIDHSCFQNIFFFSWEKKAINYCLHVMESNPIPFNLRNERFVIHGGGWGIGTYKKKIPQLTEKGFRLDIIGYEGKDIENRDKTHRYFIIDPNWEPWKKNKNEEFEFPLFGEVKKDGSVHYKNNKRFHEAYHLTRNSKAIISKPGGGTLIDSLSSATPMILLEPYGEHEYKNALLWEYLGFAISYENWIDSNCSFRILEKLHKNLLNIRHNVHEYVEAYHHATKN